MRVAMLLLLLIALSIQLMSADGSLLYPVIAPNVTQLLRAAAGAVAGGSGGGYYRELLVDEEANSFYVGGRNNVYRISLVPQSIINASIPSAATSQPNFGSTDSISGTEDNSSSDIFRYINSVNSGIPIIQLLATEKLAATYKLKNLTLVDQCRRQVRMLTFYYGANLQLSLDPDVVCSAHARGLVRVSAGANQGWLFSLRTGLFGTLPLAPTGVNDFDQGWPKWREAVERLAATKAEAQDYRAYQPPGDLYQLVYSRIANASRLCYSCNASLGYQPGSTYCTNPSQSPNSAYPLLCYNPPAAENYMGLYGRCDYRGAPTRTMYNVSNLGLYKSNTLIGGNREPCTGGLLASLLLAGYHPDQRTVAFKSQSGNGPGGNQTAIYVLTEIGQEKQLDVNHEAFMGYEEPAPLTSSASLAIVRLLVNGDDVDAGSIVVSNPFKYTWVTSPMTKFGRMVKTGNMATVPHRPRAVAIFEDNSFVYFFFREVDWESIPQPEYSVQRYHYLWRSYDRTVAYPWEGDFISRNFTLQPERTTPAKYWLHWGRPQPVSRIASAAPVLTNFERNQHVYNPSLHGWQQTWNGATMISRVARVCKNDRGLPTGTFDASFFNLDNKMSLRSFQTFLKARLKCSVAVPATPRSWRMRQDLYSFLWTLTFAQYPEFNVFANVADYENCINYACGFSFACQQPFYNCTNCPPLTLSDPTVFDYGASCAFNKRGKDVTFRAFMNYADDFSQEAVDKAAFKLIANGWKDFHWSYLSKFPTFSASYVHYNELRDIFRVGNAFYGVFGSQLSEEQAHMQQANTNNLPQQALYGSAVCKYTLDDIQQAFNGPFKKRVNNAWRPVDPRVGAQPVSPNPYSCDPDPTVEEQARKFAGMNIDFADFTLPLDKELKDFDLRAQSARLNFFEKDVEGSRTMWQDVSSEAFLSHAGKMFDKIVVDNLGLYDVLFIATSEGEILKVASWTQQKKCWQTDGDMLRKWWQEDTKLLNNIWGSYFNLTQESSTSIPDDFLFSSQWDCSPSTNHAVLSILRPFNVKQKIWDMKIYKRTLVIATDEQVIQLSMEQCNLYSYCDACSKDPYCGWNLQEAKCQPYTAELVQNVTGTSACQTACATSNRTIQLGDNILLDVKITRGDSQIALAWYHNNTQIVDAFPKVFKTENGSLAVLSISSLDLGTWELRDTSTLTCVAAYRLLLSPDCSSPECIYQREYDQWKRDYDTFSSTASSWYKQIQNDNCLVDSAATTAQPGTAYP